MTFYYQSSLWEQTIVVFYLRAPKHADSYSLLSLNFQQHYSISTVMATAINSEVGCYIANGLSLTLA